ncbi:MAG: Bug family tripartite tricarboxylate transporter substrate binding protein [Cupriavidus necator]
MISIAALLCAAMVAPARAQQTGWPSRPINLIVPFPPGGPADQTMRFVGTRLALALGQPVIIENVAGVGGVIAMRRLRRAAPDGYTIGFGHIGTLAMNPHIYREVGYDPRHDFVGIAQLYRYEKRPGCQCRQPIY